MANEDLIKSGTATVKNGSRTVTGQNVEWSPVLPGDFFGAHVGLMCPIESVKDNVITLKYGWPGVSATAAPYAIQPQGDVQRFQGRVRSLLEVLSVNDITAETDELRGIVETLQAQGVTGLKICATWAELNAFASTDAKQGAEVLSTDTGSHTDPVVGGVVPNAGIYQRSLAPVGWKRIGANGISDALVAIDKLKAPSTAIIGRPDNPVTAGGVADAVYIWADPAQLSGSVASIQIFAQATGTLKLTRWTKSGNTVTRQQEVTFQVTALGLQTITSATFGYFPINAGEFIGLRGPGIFGASSEASDGSGWWQCTDGLTPAQVSAIFTTFRLQVKFTLSQRTQAVTAERLVAVEEKAANIDTIRGKVTALDGSTVQVIGRAGDPSAGSAVGDMFFVWNTPSQGGLLTSLTINAVAAGPIQVATYANANGTGTRMSVMDLTVPGAGLFTFDEADLAGFEVPAGQYVALRASGILAANSTPADSGGWYQATPFVNPTALDGPYVAQRLEARFVVEESSQVVTAESFLELTTRVDELVGAPAAVEDGSLIAISDWGAPGASTHKGPIVGGRGRQHIKPVRERRLAHLGAKADIYNAPATISDVNDAANALYGSVTPVLVSAPETDVILAPAAVNAVACDVRNGSIRWNFRPIAGMASNLDRFSFELHSAGSPASPTGDYHTTDIYLGPSQLGGSLTGKTAAGRWQSYSISTPQFTAVGAGADLSAVKFARVRLRSSAGNSISVAIGDITFAPNWFAKAKAVLYFDDGYLEQLYAARQMARYGFRGVLFPSPARNIGVMPNLMTPAHVVALHDQLGWQIGSQAWSTEENAYVDSLDEDGITAELSRLRNWQNALGVTGGDHGSYFSGVDKDDMIAFKGFRKHFRSMRAFGGGWESNPPMIYGETLPYGDPMAIRALDAETPGWGATNGQRLCDHVDQAIANKGLAAMVWHGGMGAAGNVRTGLNTLLAYLDTKRDQIDVVTEEEIHHWPLEA
jgi:hypothetical protein